MRPLAAIIAALWVCLCTPGRAQDLAIVDATVYPAPNAPPQTHTTLVIEHGTITGIGAHLPVPTGVRTLPCTHCVVFAGFWNTHVHFTGPQWNGAATRPAPELTHSLQAMLTHSGFTTVVDTASDPANTTALRRRIEAGEVLGPRIFTAGFGLYPPHGIPFYLDDLPAAVRATLPQPETPAAAVAAVDRNLAFGTDVVKLFTGSYLSPDHITHMPLPVAQAAVTEGHRHHQLVFAHPSDLGGVHIALQAGVDVLAHAPDTIDGVDDALLRGMVAQHMAMTPTLQLFSGSGHIAGIRAIVARFHALGGTLLFGTDTGFLPSSDITEEFHQLRLAGLSFPDVLSMLTTAPAAEFGLSAHAGTLRPGNQGDLTILSADPATGSLEEFTHVAYTVRAGRVIFAAPMP